MASLDQTHDTIQQMAMFKFILASITTLLLTKSSFGQDSLQVIFQSTDRYTNYVAKLERGETDIDFLDFRLSFLKSNNFRRKDSAYKILEQQYFRSAHSKNHLETIRLAKGLLSIDYTNMGIHQQLAQIYRIQKDKVNQKKHQTIKDGLLNSITRNGNGKSCDNAWDVIQNEEEYFVLRNIGLPYQPDGLKRQRKNSCDHFLIRTNDRTYHFNVSKIIETENKLD